MVIWEDKIARQWYWPNHGVTVRRSIGALARAVVAGLGLAVALGGGSLGVNNPLSKFLAQWRCNLPKSQMTVRHLGFRASRLDACGLKEKPPWKENFRPWRKLPEAPSAIAFDQARVFFSLGEQLRGRDANIAMLTYAGPAAMEQLLSRIPSLGPIMGRSGGLLGPQGPAVKWEAYPFRPVVERVAEAPDDRPARWTSACSRSVARAPYPPSPVIAGIQWAPSQEILRLAPGSDNWPITWGDDDHLYTAYGDGWGFEPRVPRKLSLGFARVEGVPPAIRGINIRSASGEQYGDGPRGKKASGMLMVNGVLYMLVRNAGNAQLAWSEDHGQSWQWAPWKFTKSFGCPTFLNFGKNYAGASTEYVYIYSPDSEDAYTPADRMILARVPQSRLRDQSAYEYFAGFDPEGYPQWTRNLRARQAIFEHCGRCWRSGITYNPALRRYLWRHVYPVDSGAGGARVGRGCALYDAPDPWGPWTTVYYCEKWDVDPGESGSFPTKWMSADGITLWLVFSGDDCFAVRQARLELRDEITR